MISNVSCFFSWLPCISIHPYHRKIAPSISKIGRYIFLEILFWRRFFANGINFIRGSHKLTVTMSSNDVSSSSAFFYWFSSPYKILWKPFFEQTMRFSQHHIFPGLFSFQKGGIVTLHERSRTPDLSVAHYTTYNTTYYQRKTVPWFISLLFHK